MLMVTVLAGHDDSIQEEQPEWIDDGSLPLNKDESLPFYYIDAHEDSHIPQTVYLFGKVKLAHSHPIPSLICLQSNSVLGVDNKQYLSQGVYEDCMSLSIPPIQPNVIYLLQWLASYRHLQNYRNTCDGSARNDIRLLGYASIAGHLALLCIQFNLIKGLQRLASYRMTKYFNESGGLAMLVSVISNCH